MSRVRYASQLVALGLVAYVVFLAMTLPAALALPALLDSRLPPGIELGEFKGSIWNGSARITRVHGLDLGELGWKVHFFPLLTATVSAAAGIGREGVDAAGNIRIHGNQVIELDDVVGAIDLEELVAADLLFPGIEGNVTFSITDAELRAGMPSRIAASAQLNGLRLAFLPDLELGNYHANATMVGDEVQIDIDDQGGPLNVDLTLLLAAEGRSLRYTLQGNLRPKPGQPPRLAQALQWLGEPDASGNYVIRQLGRVSP